VLGALGYGEGLSDDNDQRRRYVYRANATLFIITRPINGQPATAANGGTIGFTCQSTEQVDRWHAASVSPTVEPRLKRRPTCVRPRLEASISPICAIRTATSSAPCIAYGGDIIVQEPTPHSTFSVSSKASRT
jgi:hypothetical protein